MRKIQRYIGIDISKNRCRACIMDYEGFVLDEFNFDNNYDGIDSLIAKLSMDDKIVMESTGNLWINIYDKLEDNGIQCTLANPMKMKAIASARIKSDKIDSRILAHLLRVNLVAESYVPSRELREVRALIRHRASLVKTKTMVKNRVHSIIDKYGMKYEYSDLFGKAGTRWLESIDLKSSDRLMLDNYLLHIQSIKKQISRVDEEIIRIASEDEYVRLLMSMTGIDIYAALLIRSEIGDISRFSDYKKLVAWAGLAPSLHQSGNTLYTGRITKHGSSS